MALQPALAGDLLADVAAGTPQRFAWSWSTDPTIPDVCPAWPGELAWTIPPVIHVGQTMVVDPAVAGEIRGQHMAAVRGEIEPDPIEAHAMLLRLKVAGLLAVGGLALGLGLGLGTFQRTASSTADGTIAGSPTAESADRKSVV